MGQLLSCSIVRHVFPGPKPISGVAADIVLRTPGIRLLYSWLGIRKAGRQSILDMFEQNLNVSDKESSEWLRWLRRVGLPRATRGCVRRLGGFSLWRTEKVLAGWLFNHNSRRRFFLSAFFPTVQR